MLTHLKESQAQESLWCWSSLQNEHDQPRFTWAMKTVIRVNLTLCSMNVWLQRVSASLWNWGLPQVSAKTKDTWRSMYTRTAWGSPWKLEHESEPTRLNDTQFAFDFSTLQNGFYFNLSYVLLMFPTLGSRTLWIISNSVLVVIKCLCASQNTTQFRYY